MFHVKQLAPTTMEIKTMKAKTKNLANSHDEKPSLVLTDAEDMLITSEGWCLSHTSGSENGDGWTIQKIDEGDNFESDLKVFEFINIKVNAGSALHIKVLDFIKSSNPREYKEYTDHLELL